MKYIELWINTPKMKEPYLLSRYKMLKEAKSTIKAIKSNGIKCNFILVRL